MEKTEGKKTVIVIDDQGNFYESTYPKRAKGLIKTGRARYVDDNTICLACPPNKYNLEEKKMNDNKEIKLDENYILEKIEEIIQMNKEALNNPHLADMTVMPGAKNPVQAICETNDKLIDFLKEIYFNLNPKQSNTKATALEKLSDAMVKAVEADADEDVISNITAAILNLKDL